MRLALAGALLLLCRCGGDPGGPGGSAGTTDGGDEPDPGSGGGGGNGGKGGAGGGGNLDAGKTADAGVDRGKADTRPSPDVVFAPVKCGSNLIFCEDFEAGAVDPAKWTSSVRGDLTMDFDGTHVAAGKYALHINLKDYAANWAYLQSVQKLTIKDNTLYIRFFVYLDKALASRVTQIAWSRDNTGYKSGWGIGLFGAQGFDARSYVIGEVREKIGNAPPVNQMSCWEVAYFGHQSQHFYLDGQEVSDLTIPITRNVDGNFPDSQGPIAIGVQMLDNLLTEGESHIWIDELAVSPQRIGCSL